MARPDDDALSWEGDDDPTLDTGGGAAADDAVPGTDPALADPAPAVEPAPAVPEPAPVAAPAEPAAVDPEPELAPAAVAPASAEPAGAGEPAAADDADGPRRLGDAALVSLGVLGGVYLLWTIGWVLGTLRLREWIEITTGAVADAMFHGSMVLGILAPAIWFGTAWYLTRRRPTWVRIGAIVLGVIVLVPWPFVMVGVIGQ